MNDALFNNITVTNNFSDLRVMIYNTQGFETKVDYNKRLMECTKPTFCTLGEIKLREADAMSIQDHFKNMCSVSSTPDMRISDLEDRLEWRKAWCVLI